MQAAAGHESLSLVIITDHRLLPRTLVLLGMLYSTPFFICHPLGWGLELAGAKS